MRRKSAKRRPNQPVRCSSHLAGAMFVMLGVAFVAPSAHAQRKRPMPMRSIRFGNGSAQASRSFGQAPSPEQS